MEVLESFEFQREGGKGSRYDQYLDGRIYKFVLGVDVPITFRSGFVTLATRRGKKVRTQMVDDGQSIIVQAYDPEESS